MHCLPEHVSLFLAGSVFGATTARAHTQDLTSSDCTGLAGLIFCSVEPTLQHVAPGANREQFVKDWSAQNACPNVEAACAASPFVMTGDIVIVHRMMDDYACAIFKRSRPKMEFTRGWLPTEALADRQAPAPGGKGGCLKEWP